MPDREKVMQGLKICVQCREPKDCDGCPYEGERTYAVPCGHVLMADALALLKEQEARVMTLEEVEEMAAKSDPDPVFAEWIMGGTGWIVGSIHHLADLMKNGYRNIRVWTSRPTPEHMANTPWEDDSDGNVDV